MADFYYVKSRIWLGRPSVQYNNFEIVIFVWQNGKSWYKTENPGRPELECQKRATVAAFKASGKECEARGAAHASFCLSICARTHSFPVLYLSTVDFWYWGIDPKNSTYMNTFIERPAIQARLMYWLMALHDVRGMLYCE